MLWNFLGYCERLRRKERTHQQNIFNSIAVLVLWFTALTVASAQNYTFTKIVDTSHFGYLGVPAINNSGTVAFGASGGAGIQQGIFTATSDGTITTIADNSDSFAAFVPEGSSVAHLFVGSQTDINNSGTVAFWGSLRDAGRQGIFTGNGGPITTVISEPSGVRPFSLYGINNGGTVVFGTNGTWGRGNAGPVTLSAEGSEPSINDGGTVAYRKNLIPGIASPGIVTSAGRKVVSWVESNIDPEAPSINNSGVVAFAARDYSNNFQRGIYVGCGVPLGSEVIPQLTLIASSDGPFNAPGNGVNINDRGTVAFYSGLDAGGGGIFTGPDPIADKVIATGDMLLGSIVNGVVFSPHGLNNAGQITFFAFLKDSQGNDLGAGIYRADPIVSTPPDEVILPINTEPPWHFVFNLTPNTSAFDCPAPPVRVDPDIAVGYEYVVDSGPNYVAFTLPNNLGDNVFTLYTWDDSEFQFDRMVAGGQQVFFPPEGVSRFRIFGIDPAAGVDPSDPLAFMTNLVFAGSGTVQMTMTPQVLAQTIAGDYDNSGTVGLEDYGIWGANFDTTNAHADGNGDGNVDAADYVVWRKNLIGLGANSQSDIAQTNAPEPQTLMIASIFLITLAVSRRVTHSRLLPYVPVRGQGDNGKRRGKGGHSSTQLFFPGRLAIG